MLFYTYNIHCGVGADGRYDVTRIADAAAEADIVCLQEAAAGWQLNGYADQTAGIAQRLNHYHWYHGAMEADASELGTDGRIVTHDLAAKVKSVRIGYGTNASDHCLICSSSN